MVSSLELIVLSETAIVIKLIIMAIVDLDSAISIDVYRYPRVPVKCKLAKLERLGSILDPRNSKTSSIESRVKTFEFRVESFRFRVEETKNLSLN